MSQSKYAKRLQDRGFEPLPPEMQEPYTERVITKIKALYEREGRPFGRRERRLALKKFREPHFSIVKDDRGIDTYATDEKGMHWIAPGRAESLKDLGFTDNVGFMAEAISAVVREGASVH